MQEALERIAAAFERIATVLEDEAKIGGAFGGLQAIAKALQDR